MTTSSRRLKAVLLVAVAILSCGPLASGANDSKAEKNEAKDKLLRHAVFFKFKDSAGKEDAERVVEAFRALPAKIDEIEKLQSGEAIKGSGRNDGLTHCFLLTFADDAGRAAYLPHPDHKAFGNVLRPHLEKVFVVDYWGTPEKTPRKKPLKHGVFFKFKEGIPANEVKAVEDGLAALPAKIDVIKALEWGTNNSPEKHDEGFTHCYMFTFESEKALKEYAEHPDHVEVAQLLLPKVEKVRVIDFWADEVKKGE